MVGSSWKRWVCLEMAGSRWKWQAHVGNGGLALKTARSCWKQQVCVEDGPENGGLALKTAGSSWKWWDHLETVGSHQKQRAHAENGGFVLKTAGSSWKRRACIENSGLTLKTARSHWKRRAHVENGGHALKTAGLCWKRWVMASLSWKWWAGTGNGRPKLKTVDLSWKQRVRGRLGQKTAGLHWKWWARAINGGFALKTVGSSLTLKRVALSRKWWPWAENSRLELDGGLKLETAGSGWKRWVGAGFMQWLLWQWWMWGHGGMVHSQWLRRWQLGQTFLRPIASRRCRGGSLKNLATASVGFLSKHSKIWQKFEEYYCTYI